MGLAAAGGALVLLTGAGFGSMRNTVRTDGRTTAASAPSAGRDAGSGAVLFQAKGCAGCHEGPDSEPRVGGFPSLKDVPSFAGDRREGMSAAAYVAESIREPAAFISPAFRSSVGPVAAMPTLAVSDAEVDALVAYLLGS